MRVRRLLMVRIRFFEFTPASSSPSPSALAGVSMSTLAIQFGLSGSVPGLGRLRQLRTASSRNKRPRTILPQEIVSEAVLVVGLLWFAIK